VDSIRLISDSDVLPYHTAIGLVMVLLKNMVFDIAYFCWLVDSPI